jgi:hypothetical protein
LLLSLLYGWSMLLKKQNLLLMCLWNISNRKFCCLWFYIYIFFPDWMYLFLEFETDFSIAENKRCLSRVVDCSNFLRYLCLCCDVETFVKRILMVFSLCVFSLRVQVLRQALFLKTILVRR